MVTLVKTNIIQYCNELPDHCYTVTTYDKNRNAIAVNNFIGTKYESAFYYAVDYILEDCGMSTSEANQNMVEHLYDSGKNFFNPKNGNEYTILYSEFQLINAYE